MLNEALSLATTAPQACSAPVAPVSTPALAAPATEIVGAIQELFGILTGSDPLVREMMERLVKVDRSPGKMEVVGSGRDVLAALGWVSRSLMNRGVPAMRAAMINATEELSAMGITWEETSPGKRMRKVFHIVRSV